MFDNPYFEPTSLDKGSLHSDSNVRPQHNSLWAEEGGCVYAGTHLALARPQNLGTALWVNIKKVTAVTFFIL